MQQFELHSVAPRVRALMLVVHDRDDRINAFADGKAFADAIQGARLLATEGLGHRPVRIPLISATKSARAWRSLARPAYCS